MPDVENLEICPVCGADMNWATCDRYCLNKECSYREPHIHTEKSRDKWKYCSECGMATYNPTFVCTCIEWKTPEESKKRRRKSQQSGDWTIKRKALTQVCKKCGSLFGQYAYILGTTTYG